MPYGLILRWRELYNRTFELWEVGLEAVQQLCLSACRQQGGPFSEQLPVNAVDKVKRNHHIIDHYGYRNQGKVVGLVRLDGRELLVWVW